MISTSHQLAYSRRTGKVLKSLLFLFDVSDCQHHPHHHSISRDDSRFNHCRDSCCLSFDRVEMMPESTPATASMIRITRLCH